MDSSQVRCTNCSQYFNNNDIVYASTICGHVFHQKCLFDKFNRGSRMCGGNQECSSMCYPRYCRRLYLTFNSFSWFHIEPKIFLANEKEFEGMTLKLGINNNGHNIYAARVFQQDKFILCFYNAVKQKAYRDLECTLDYFSKYIEVLDVSNDGTHQWAYCGKVQNSHYEKENYSLIWKRKISEEEKY